MPTTYSKTPEASMLDALSHHVREDGVHARLMDVDFRLVPAHCPVDKETGKPTGDPALASKGIPLTWERKITNVKLRAADAADVIVYIDSDQWGEFTPGERIAEMDKVLTSIKVGTEESGAPKLDDLGRPKLTTQNPDQVIEVYHAVVKRGGNASSDIKKIRKVMATHDQLFLTGMGMEAANTAEPPPVHH